MSLYTRKQKKLITQKPFITHGLRYKHEDNLIKEFLCIDNDEINFYESGEENLNYECVKKNSMELVLVKLLGKPPKENIFPMMNKF